MAQGSDNNTEVSITKDLRGEVPAPFPEPPLLSERAFEGAMTERASVTVGSFVVRAIPARTFSLGRSALGSNDPRAGYRPSRTELLSHDQNLPDEPQRRGSHFDGTAISRFRL